MALTTQPLKIVYMDIDSIKPNPKNPRVIKDERYKKLVQSIKDFPEMLELRPIIVNKGMMILGGNMRRIACKEAGMKKVPVYKASNLSKKQEREFTIKDNINFGEWDFDMLANSWEVEQLNNWGLQIPNFDPPAPEIANDNHQVADDIKTDILPGDLFKIGPHRLLCGDSTSMDAVERLMDKKKFQLLATSPPYNQGNGTGDLLTSGKKKVKLYQDKNADNLSKEEYFSFLISVLTTAFAFRDKSHSIIWNVAYNAKSRNDYGKIVFSDQNPFQVMETIIWDKGHSINLPQVGIYSRRCEMIFVMTADEKYRTTQKYNDCRWNYYDVSGANGQLIDTPTEHRAVFPIKLAEQIINDFSFEEDIIYEPFLGSGTTMAAAHQMKRICYGMELDPKYCQVILDRMLTIDPEVRIKKNGKPYKKTGNKQA